MAQQQHYAQRVLMPMHEPRHSNAKVNLAPSEDFSSHGNGGEKRKVKSLRQHPNVRHSDFN
jgi:hypothetical protein